MQAIREEEVKLPEIGSVKHVV